MVIDFHTHCFPDMIADNAVKALSKAAGIPAHTDGTVLGLKESMKKAGINKSIVQSIATKPSQVENVNTWSASIQDDEIIAFGSIHPLYGDYKKELRKIKASGLPGIKLHPEYQSFYVDDEKMYSLYDQAFSLDLVILFHAGADIGFKPPYHGTPERLLRLVEKFQGATIIAAHMGGFNYWNQVEEMLVGKEIYFDISYSLGHIPEAQAVRMIEKHGYDKVLFGTDLPWTDSKEELQKLNALELEQTQKDAILGQNARRTLGL